MLWMGIGWPIRTLLDVNRSLTKSIVLFGGKTLSHAHQQYTISLSTGFVPYSIPRHVVIFVLLFYASSEFRPFIYHCLIF